MNLRKGAAAVAISIVSGPALAAGVLPIAGAFGDELGCAYYMNGGLDIDETFAVITPHTLATHLGGCYFEKLVAESHNGAYEVAVSCTGEGADFPRTVSVINRGADGIFVAALPLGEWGPLFRCPGTENLFEPLGTRV